MKTLYLYGASGHAKVVIDIARRTANYTVAGLFDDDPAKQGGTLLGLPILGGWSALAQLRADEAELFVAIGNNRERRRIGRDLLARGFTLATLLHPSAIVGMDVSIGAGTVLMPGAIVNPSTVIGPLCILNTAASVDHDGILGEAVHVCPGTRLGGHVTVGDESWIGIGSCVIEGRTIGRRCLVGAGAAVIRDVPDDSKIVGVPAHPIG
jgi:sugar O-acyltransferase (sialic acid O-acetyltransferase NeuD family)